MRVTTPGFTQAVYPASHGVSVHPRSRSRWFEPFDSLLLPRNRHELSPADLSRARVIAITASALFLVNLAFLLALPKALDPALLRTLLVIPGITLVGYLVVLGLLRVRRSPRLPALLLCSLTAFGYIGTNLAVKNPTGASHVASPLFALLAFFLLGARGGFVFAVLMSLYTLVIQPLYLAGVTRWNPLGTGASLAVGDAFAALCIMGAWGLSWLHSRARDKAQHALELTLRSLAEGERKLSSLVESTDDIVCSLDAQGRLLTANTAMRRWFSRLFDQQPRLGEPLAVPRFLEHHPEWPEHFHRALGGERVRVEAVYPLGDKRFALDFSLTAIADEAGQAVGVTLFGRDVTARREAEARLGELHRTLLETSRKAGMAEIATGVLHNVGNTLNSVNVSVTLVGERLRGSRVPGLVRAAELMRDHRSDLGAFLTGDERGRLLPEYLLSVSRQLAEEQATMLVELQSLTKNVEHIKSVVSMQQEHARVVGMVEQVALPELLDDALRLHATSFERLGIQVRREYGPVPSLTVDRHKLLQILVNLLSNARHALLDSHRPDKQLTLRVTPQPGDRLRIEVADNGVGISPEHMPRMFTQGFTTKKDGHGFGLHASALAASDMNGGLTCSSAGPGQGATFTIDLPLTPEQARE